MRRARAVFGRQQVMRAQEAANRSVEPTGVYRAGVDVAAANFDECFFSGRSLIQAPAFGDRNHRILWAVQKQERSAHATDLADRVEMVSHDQPNGEERILLLRDGDD